MAVTLLIIAMWVFGILSLRRKRWAYVAFVALGFLYFPARVGFQLQPRACRFDFDIPLAMYSLNNHAHIVLFALFFVMTSFQFDLDKRSSYLKAGLLTLVMGALVELGEGLSGRGNCRIRDLVPDLAGAVVGAMCLFPFLHMRSRVRAARHTRV